MKKIFFYAIALTLGLSMTSCSGSDTESETNKDSVELAQYDFETMRPLIAKIYRQEEMSQQEVSQGLKIAGNFFDEMHTRLSEMAKVDDPVEIYFMMDDMGYTDYGKMQAYANTFWQHIVRGKYLNTISAPTDEFEAVQKKYAIVSDDLKKLNSKVRGLMFEKQAAEGLEKQAATSATQNPKDLKAPQEPAVVAANLK